MTNFFFQPTDYYDFTACLFSSVVVINFQIIFRVKIHANNIFLFLKKLFLTLTN
jgi:hypothetical protein